MAYELCWALMVTIEITDSTEHLIGAKNHGGGTYAKTEEYNIDVMILKAKNLF